MIYFGDFSQIWPNNFVTIAINNEPPADFKGHWLKRLAPTTDIDAIENEETFMQVYEEKILGILHVHDIVNYIYTVVDEAARRDGRKDYVPILLTDRLTQKQLVMKWLIDAGFEVIEYILPKEEDDEEVPEAEEMRQIAQTIIDERTKKLQEKELESIKERIKYWAGKGLMQLPAFELIYYQETLDALNEKEYIVEWMKNPPTAYRISWKEDKIEPEKPNPPSFGEDTDCGCIEAAEWEPFNNEK